MRTVVPEDEPQPTKRAQKEATRIAEGNLRRDEAVRANIHIAGLVVFWVLIIVLVAMGLVWAWHMAVPDRWRFLTTEEQNNIQTILLSAIASSFATQLIRRWEDPRAPSDADDDA